MREPRPTAKAELPPTPRRTRDAAAADGDVDAGVAFLVGYASIGNGDDSIHGGDAEVFRVAAVASGVARKIAVYISGRTTIMQVRVAIYSGDKSAAMQLLAAGTIMIPALDAWNTIAIAPTPIARGSMYWIGVLGIGPFPSLVGIRSTPGGGPAFAAPMGGLSGFLPTWSNGVPYTDAPLSAYAIP